MSTSDEAGERLNESRDADVEPRGRRAALWAFLGVEGVGLALFLVIGRNLWFHVDEWDFLAARTGGNLGDLFRPHGNVHPSTLPILAYRFLWTLFGLRTYVPYRLLLLCLHLGAALLLRVLMRRAGVRPWTATIAASLFVLFGAGYQDIMWPTLIGFGGALLFGLVQLLLADHDGPLDRRDGLALLAGLAAMLCSALAVTMVLVVGIATLWRRGWRVAAVLTLPLELMYFVWWVTLARGHYDAKIAPIGLIARFVVRTPANTLQALGQLPGMGLVLGVVLVVGFALAHRRDPRAFRTRLAPVTALLIGALLFVVNTAVGRAGGSIAATERSRYLYVVALMLMPALAVAADAITREWRVLAPVVIALFVVGIPGNIKTLADDTHSEEPAQQSLRRTVLVMPRLPIAPRVPRAFVPETTDLGYYIHMGWLVDGVADGKIPSPGRISAAEVATDTLRLSLTKYYRGLIPPASSAGRCVSPRLPVHLRLDRGQFIVVRHGWFELTPVPNPPGEVLPLSLRAAKGGFSIGVTSGPVEATIVSHDKQPILCAPPRAFVEGPPARVTG